MAAGADEALAGAEELPERPLETMRVLGRIPTFRRIWLAVPFLGIALFGIPNLLSLVYEDVFGLNAAARGIITAGIEPLQIVGVIVSLPWVSRIAATRPPSSCGSSPSSACSTGSCSSASPTHRTWPLAVAMHALLAASIGTLAPAFFAMLSLVAPPRVRAAAFSTMSVFAIPGIAVFLPPARRRVGRGRSPGEHAAHGPRVPRRGFILSSRGRTLEDDIQAVRTESLARVAATTAGAGGAAPPT
jgi:hypothetical protein